jgi:hypothetical protein
MDDINVRNLRNYFEASVFDNSTRNGRAADLYAAASGSGGYCPEGIPVELALCLLLAAFAITFGILYRAVTKITGGRRRKKRFTDIKEVLQDYQDRCSDILWWGRFTLLKNLLKIFLLISNYLS